MTARKKAAINIAIWRVNPVQFVRDSFKVEPDLWQADALMALVDDSVSRISLQACVGPGKSCVLAWSAWWFLTCMAGPGEHPKGAAVSITSDNLKDNLWAELSKWQERSEFLMAAFTWTKERVFAKDHPSTWFMSARSWSKTANAEEQGRTLSGLHSEYVLVLADETGDMPAAVLKAADQALSNCKWGKVMMAGNPTSHNGILYLAATKLRELWKVIRITSDPDDPKRTPRVDAEWAREQIKTHGRDDPWVMSSILGQFPSTSINNLLTPDEVQTAMERGIHEEDYKYSQKRLGVDVAREGLDSTVLFPRQGLRAYPAVEMRNARNPEIAGRILLAKQRWMYEIVFVDSTGGFGGGVCDALLQSGEAPQEIHFSSKALDPRYFNRRAEMWMEMAEWVKRGGCLPNDPRLLKELTAVTYTTKDGKFILESKEQIKKRLGFSPDKADALALTFAIPEMPANMVDNIPLIGFGHQGKVEHEWDPLKDS